MFEPTPTWPNVDFRQLFMWIEQSHIWPFRLNITFGWLQKLNPGYEICIISYQVNLSSEVSAMFNSLMPSLNIRSLPFVVDLGGFPSRCQNLSSGAIRPGGLLFMCVILCIKLSLLTTSWSIFFRCVNNFTANSILYFLNLEHNLYTCVCLPQGFLLCVFIDTFISRLILTSEFSRYVVEQIGAISWIDIYGLPLPWWCLDDYWFWV